MKREGSALLSVDFSSDMRKLRGGSVVPALPACRVTSPTPSIKVTTLPPPTSTLPIASNSPAKCVRHPSFPSYQTATISSMDDCEVSIEDFDLSISELNTSVLSRDNDEKDLSGCQETVDLDDETVFEPGSEEYRKARKRRQNRESASRSRMLKKNEMTSLQQTIKSLRTANAELKRENRALKLENDALLLDAEMRESNPQKKRKTGRSDVTIPVFLIAMLCLYMVSSGEAGGEADGRRLLTVREEKMEIWSGVYFIIAVSVCLALLFIRKFSKAKKGLLPIYQ